MEGVAWSQFRWVADDLSVGIGGAGEAAREGAFWSEGPEEGGLAAEGMAEAFGFAEAALVEAFGGHGEGGAAFGEDAVGVPLTEAVGHFAEAGGFGGAAAGGGGAE